jgi:hypothetical protein
MMKKNVNCSETVETQGRTFEGESEPDLWRILSHEVCSNLLLKRDLKSIIDEETVIMMKRAEYFLCDFEDFDLLVFESV